MSAFLAGVFGGGKVDAPAWGIGEYDGLSLLATPAGFFVLDPDELAAARNAALSPEEAREYARPVIVSLSGNSRRDIAQRRRDQYLSAKICMWYAAQFEKEMLAFYQRQEEKPQERRLFEGSQLGLGRKIAFGAIDWSWTRYGTLRIEEVAGPVDGTLIEMEGHQGVIFLPRDGLQTVTIWPTKAVFRYASKSIMLDLHEPEWQTLV